MNEELNQYRRNLFRMCYTNRSFSPFEMCRVVGNKFKGPCKKIIIRKYRFGNDDTDPSRVIIYWNGNHNWIMKIKLLHDGVVCRKRVSMNHCESIFEMEQVLLNQIHLIQFQIHIEKNNDQLADDFPF